MDERQWLLATAYNTGTECLQYVHSHEEIHLIIPSFLSASFFDEAKRWFEAATVICRFVPGGRERADKVSLQSSFCCKRDAYGASFFLCRSQNRIHNCSLDIIKHGPCKQPPRLVEPMHSTQTLRK